MYLCSTTLSQIVLKFFFFFFFFFKFWSRDYFCETKIRLNFDILQVSIILICSQSKFIYILLQAERERERHEQTLLFLKAHYLYIPKIKAVSDTFFFFFLI